MSEDGQLFLELFELQGNRDMVTKAELKKGVEQRGMTLSDRTLTTLITEGFMPKSARVGSDAGVFPAIVVDLVCCILMARRAQLSFAAIKELLPVWRFLKRAVLHPPYELDLLDLERVARREVQSREAACAIPWMVPAAIARELEEGTRPDLKLKDRAGVVRPLLDDEPSVISFVVLQPDKDDELLAYPDGHLEVVLPRQTRPEPDRHTVFIGAPPAAVVVADRRRLKQPSDQRRAQPEVLDGSDDADSEVA